MAGAGRKRSQPEQPVSLDLLIRGRVQGVGFRYFAHEAARMLELAGYVLNLQDGSLRAYAEGPRPALEQFLARMAEGPAGSRVRGLYPVWGAATGRYTRFSIDPMR